MINYIEGDLFEYIKADQEPSPIIIPHVVNNKGSWGSGFVVPLGQHFPASKDAYLEWHQYLSNGKSHKTTYKNFSTSQLAPLSDLNNGLGDTQIIKINNKIYVANMMAQVLGTDRPLYYNHLARCMDSVAKQARQLAAVRIVCPSFGSNRAKGDWRFITELITDCWIKIGIPVTVFYLKGTLPEIENKPKNKQTAAP